MPQDIVFPDGLNIRVDPFRARIVTGTGGRDIVPDPGNGGGGSSPPVVFDPPDLLDASFESGYDGFVGQFGNPPPTASRVTDWAADGITSIKETVLGGGAPPEQHFYNRYNFGEQSGDLFVRSYVRLSAAPPDQSTKYIRVSDVFFNGPHFGLYFHANGNGHLVCAFQTEGNTNIDIQVGVPTPNVTHWVEYVYSWNGGINGGDAARFWWDGQPTYGTGNVGGATWRDLSGDGHLWIDSNSVTGIKAAWLWALDTVNANNANAGSYWWDLVALSTKRIGP